MRSLTRRQSQRLWLPLLLMSLAVAFAWSLEAGPLRLSLRQIFGVLLESSGDETVRAVVMHVRLPRALLAALVGASLASAGGAFQAVLRNPLADPYLLGVSGGAGLGAVAAMACGAQAPLAVPAAACCGALAALAAVYGVGRGRNSSPHTLILAGVMVGSLAAALLLLLLWGVPAASLRGAVAWLAGDLAGADPDLFVPLALWSFVAFLVLWRQAPALDLFTQGEDAAADLGLDVGQARRMIFAAAGALTAGAVALGGLVGFVGLVVPHAARLLGGPAHRRLLPASALGGAAFLVAADALARALFAPAELPVGVVTALLGAPAFLWLLRRGGEDL